MLLHRGTVLYDPAADHQYVANELQDREFFAAVTEGRQPAVSAFDVLPALAILQQVQDQNPPRRQSTEPTAPRSAPES